MQKYAKIYANICENIRVYVFAYGSYICTPHFADGAGTHLESLDALSYNHPECYITKPACNIALIIAVLEILYNTC